MTSKKLVSLLCTLMVFSACGKSSSSGGGGNSHESGTEIRTDIPVTGKIGNAEWVFKSGIARPDFQDPQKLSITLWEEVVANPCQAFHFPTRQVMFSLPSGVGQYPLSLSQTVTLYDNTAGDNMNRVLTEGRIELTEVTANVVAGGLAGTFDAANFVNGRFSLTRCP